MTPEREKEIRDLAAPPEGGGIRGRAISELLAALDECRRELDLAQHDVSDLTHELYDALEFSQFRDSIEQTLVYVSNHILDGDHVSEIQAEVDGLLAQLGVK